MLAKVQDQERRHSLKFLGHTEVTEADSDGSQGSLSSYWLDWRAVIGRCYHGQEVDTP